MTDERDPPIMEQEFVAGVTVIDIGDVRVARGLARRAHSSCPHARLVYDQNERRVWCKDCERDVESFDAFRLLVEQFSAADGAIRRRQTELAEAQKFAARAIATKKLDDVWRSRSMVPACPHCGLGLFPDDFKDGVTELGRDYAERLNKRKDK